MFTIEGESELLVLLDALIEAKLPRLSEDQDLSASPIVANLAERAMKACRNLPERVWPRDEAWRVLSSRHGRWTPALTRAISDQDYLRRAPSSEKKEYVRLLLAPYLNDDATVLKFLNQVESILHERRWYQLWLQSTSPFGGGVAFLMEGPDGRFTAWDANHNEIVSGSIDEVGAALLDRNFEPYGYFVQGAPSMNVDDLLPSSSAPPA